MTQSIIGSWRQKCLEFVWNCSRICLLSERDIKSSGLAWHVAAGWQSQWLMDLGCGQAMKMIPWNPKICPREKHAVDVSSAPSQVPCSVPCSEPCSVAAEEHTRAGHGRSGTCYAFCRRECKEVSFDREPNLHWAAWIQLYNNHSSYLSPSRSQRKDGEVMQVAHSSTFPPCPMNPMTSLQQTLLADRSKSLQAA